MRRLHECLFSDEFDELWPLVKDGWIKRGLDDFVEYFENEWISGPTYKWRVYNSPLGFSTTNNPIESYNNKIKVQFTMRVLMSMKGICDLFKDVCAFECERLKEFSNEVKVTSKIYKRAQSFLVENSSSLKRFSVSQYIYKEHVIDLDLKSCECRFFSKNAMCHHLVAVALLENRELNG